MVDAVKNVSLKIEDGEFWGIIGHTGSGKSTLTELMCGLIKPKSGQVLIDGEDIGQVKNVVRHLHGKVGMVFQYPEHQLFEESVIKDICFGPKNLGFSEDECIKKAREAMKLVGLSERFEDLSPFELSGGEKRRVAIASILAMEPKVLILDEPTAGLDPVGRENLLKMLLEIKGSLCKSLILVSHSMEDVARCCDKVLVMNKGEILKKGTVREVFRDSEKLDKAGLDLPQITRLVKHIKSMGYEIKDDILTVDEAVEEIYNLIKGR
ncbi:MAG: energy-coupling factor transporter ATPase [Clostridia bacterium]